MIYHLLFDVPHVSLKRCTMDGPIQAKTLSPSLTRSGRRIHKLDSSYYQHGTPAMAIVFACRQLYIEAGPVYYASRIFTFSHQKYMIAFVSTLRERNPFGIFNLNAIRHVSIHGGYLWQKRYGITNDQMVLAAAVSLPCLRYIELITRERLFSEEWFKTAELLAHWCGRSASWRNALLIGPHIDLQEHNMALCARHPEIFYWREAFIFTRDSVADSADWKIELKFWHNQHCKIVEDTLGLNFDTY